MGFRASLCAAVAVQALMTQGAVPTWTPTWDMAQSTVFMPCNYSGFFDPAFAAQFGIVDYDWSNAKQMWANQQPMDCEERLITQAAMTKAVNPNTKVFVYRNLVKALPWYTNVRTKISDPRYAGWFLTFKPNATYHVPQCTDGLCTDFSHDQDQTPEHPHGDGDCVNECDCGGVVPCGEYLWDHRNESLRSYLINDVILGPTGLGNGNVSGFYLDDAWFNTSQPVQNWEPPIGFCDHSPIGGPTEEDFYCTQDMGLTQQDTTDLADGWRQTIEAVHAAIVAAGAFSWDQFAGYQTPPQKTCAQELRQACQADSPQYTGAVQWTYTAWPNGSHYPLPQFETDLAAFLLVRGPYAWLGYTWQGCSSGNQPPGGGGSPYEFPAQLRVDYGEPTGQCQETQAGSGVFVRKWSKATVSLDCNTYTPSIIVN